MDGVRDSQLRRKGRFGGILIRGTKVWKKVLFCGVIISQLHGASPATQLVPSRGSINANYGTRDSDLQQPETFFEAACEGDVRCCPCVSKFTVWVVGVGGGALTLATYFCLQRLRHYDPQDDDGSGGGGLNLLFKKDV